MDVATLINQEFVNIAALAKLVTDQEGGRVSVTMLQARVTELQGQIAQQVLNIQEAIIEKTEACFHDEDVTARRRAIKWKFQNS